MRCINAAVDTAAHLKLYGFVKRDDMLSGVFLHTQKLLRVFAALIVVFVTTYHTCGAATAAELRMLAFVDSADAGAPLDQESTVEKCHVCTVVSIPAPALKFADISDPSVVPSGTVTQLVTVYFSATAPPPKVRT